MPKKITTTPDDVRHAHAEDATRPISKRRNGFPSETSVKRGDRAVTTPLGIDKEFL